MTRSITRNLLIGALLLALGAGSTFLVLRGGEDSPAGATVPEGDEPGSDEPGSDEQGAPAQARVDAGVPGLWQVAPEPRRPQLDESVPGDTGQLADLGYAGGYEPRPTDTGVVFHAEDLAQPGLNLFNDGSAPQAILMDMQGQPLHAWRFPLEDLLEEGETLESLAEFGRVPDKFAYWRRVHPFENGDLLAILVDAALIKVDRDSRLLWAWRGAPHHDLDVDEQTGNVWVLTRKQQPIAGFGGGRPCTEDFISILSPDGELLREISLIEAFRRSEYGAHLEQCPPRGDLLHTNTLELLDGRLASRSPAFARGNVLVSLCATDTLAIVDPERERVVWTLAGSWRKQHQPTLLSNGRMLLFDNRGDRDKSKVIEFDPLTQEVHWAYRQSPQTPFLSKSCGSSERLANGNTLITESTTGRAFEVDRQGLIVWEFLTPHHAGADGEFIATLFEVLRLPLDYGADWLDD